MRAYFIFLSIFNISIVSTYVNAAKLYPIDRTLQNKDYVEIQIKGEIFPPLLKNIKTLFEKFKGKKILIDLNSPGGYMDEGKKIIQFFNDEKKSGRTIHTRVRNGNTCASMCVPIFLQGDSRIAGAVSSFMFHGAKSDHSNKPIKDKTQELIDIFNNSNVSFTFLESLTQQGAFDLPGSYWITGQQLVDQKTNIITKLTSHHIIEPPLVRNRWAHRPR